MAIFLCILDRVCGNMAELTFVRTYYTQLGDWEKKEEQSLIIKTPTQALNLQESFGVKTYYTKFSGCESEQPRLIASFEKRVGDPESLVRLTH